MKIVKVLFIALCLSMVVLVFGTTQAFAAIDTIRFGGISPGKNFKPSTLDVKVGDTILWMGFFGPADPFHQLQSVSVPSGANAFGPIITGQTFTYPVMVAGDYNYQCNNHCCSASKGMMQGSFTAAVAGVTDAPNATATLEKNFPNPFAGTTIIRYTLSRTSAVTLKIFDLNGKEVKTLVNNSQSAGSYEVTFDGSTLSSGTYIYQLQAGKAILTRQMVLIKQ